jgi:hypothetical protein
MAAEVIVVAVNMCLSAILVANIVWFRRRMKQANAELLALIEALKTMKARGSGGREPVKLIEHVRGATPPGPRRPA